MDLGENEYRGLVVRVRDNTPESLEKALGQFKKLIQKEGILQEVRDRQYFKSNSQKEYERRREWTYKNSRNKDKPKSFRKKGDKKFVRKFDKKQP